MIGAVAIKTENNEIYVSRNSHSELLVLYPDKFKNAEQGFLTSDCKFVNRVEGLAIAKKYNQIVERHGLDTELYSEDIFLNRKENKDESN